MTVNTDHFDVIVIGAGPAGALASIRLAQEGLKVCILEKSTFPRFVIGESLLPQSMVFMEKAGLLPRLEAAGFQYKDGANFSDDRRFSSIKFSDKFSEGPASTYQVEREKFDALLADAAVDAGADLRFQQDVRSVEFDQAGAVIAGEGPDSAFRHTARFLVDASGYGRVLPRLLKLDAPSDFPVRHALFTHVEEQLSDRPFDRNKILITVHPTCRDIWFWLIPFANGKSSVGAVVPPEELQKYPGSASDKLWAIINETTELQDLLQGAKELRPVGEISGYSSKVSRLAGPQFALLGNAGEFLDPVFSSGVTVAFKSADLLIDPLMRQLNGETVDWEADFAQPLQLGVDCFRVFVEAWYRGDLQDIIFNPPSDENPIKQMIVSILAGYAWDERNPFVTQGRRYLDMVAQQCA
ncbi:tryptophan 7-halogenase [Sneathiella sp. CAU 1612]|uniref:Tryptophan 7-halogenase n=1 Tax=Sneathiella sedimenti TaxID=2816034 RepID=A0ABS3F493_9PROT|nr:NAD(P)/FAD-dependent oxidoreductase [Sneathiella sedimenti]MBO0333352.1 tryptophan 7-halogenase [Sneathiella sedimenti]